MIGEIYIFLKCHLILVICCLICFCFGLFLEFLEWFYSYNISPKEIINIINHEDGLVLDLRPYLEYKKEHIIDSKNCNINKFLHDDKNKIYIERNIVLILNTKQNCRYIIKQLNLYKFKKAKCLKNGITGWRSLNLPTIST